MARFMLSYGIASSITILISQYTTSSAAQTTAAPPTPSDTIRPTTTSLNLYPSRACDHLTTQIKKCTLATSNFLLLPSSVQGSCLCSIASLNTSRTLGFDEAASICSSYKLTEPTSIPTVGFVGICSSLVTTTATLSNLSGNPTGVTPPLASTPTIGSGSNDPPVKSEKGMQSFTTPQIIGVSFGCGGIAVLIGLAIFVRRRRRKSIRNPDVLDIELRYMKGGKSLEYIRVESS